MSIKSRLRSVFAFRTLPVTILTVLVYAAIYISVLTTDELPSAPPPRKQGGLDLDGAYADLHQIAGLPHPYNSHQNDVVRAYILSRVQNIAKASPFVDVDDDRVSNVTFGKLMFGSVGSAAYFEGSNILVRINGTHPELDGVLFSAHFDSVSTAPGATDDGMGVATLVQLVRYFSKNQPRRTVVFNINNGEEDGLYGAHAFLKHPWVNLTKDFINVEGAGAGGRPLLLRTTSTRHAHAFAHAKHPHGTVLSADAFARGVVKSGTDYTVYTAAELGGIDFAFYKQRSKYHTKEDSIPSLNGKAALWNMMESTLLAGNALINGEIGNGGGAPVYFDIFGETLAVLSLQKFYIMNIVLLILGPIVVGALVFTASKKGKLYWSAKGWGRTPVALVIGGGLTITLGMVYKSLNPFIIYSSTAPVIISTLALAYISFYTVLELFSYFLHVPQQHSMVMLEVYIFWWLLLIVDTVIIGAIQIGGLYFITFFHAATLAALLVALIEHFELPATVLRKRSVEPTEDDDEGRERSSERTPLLGRNGHFVERGEIEEGNELGLWIVQFLLAVPFPVILITQMAVMMLNSLSQTLADGSSATNVYLGVSILSVFSFIPLLPFAHKMHRSISYIAVLVLAISLLYNVFAFPFSANSPLKLFFQQTIDLDTGENLVRLTGAKPWLSKAIVPELPSSWSDGLNCSLIDPLRGDANVPSCVWPGLAPHVASGSPSSWVRVNTTKTAPGVGMLSITGKGTRNCRVYFESTPVTTVSVNGSSGHVSELFPLPSTGISEFRMWSRTWDRTFELSVTWDGEKSLKGRVACEWAEKDGLPALDEVVSFLPSWAGVTKRTDGLLEAWKSFELD